MGREREREIKMRERERERERPTDWDSQIWAKRQRPTVRLTEKRETKTVRLTSVCSMVTCFSLAASCSFTTETWCRVSWCWRFNVSAWSCRLAYSRSLRLNSSFVLWSWGTENLKMEIFCLSIYMPPPPPPPPPTPRPLPHTKTI